MSKSQENAAPLRMKRSMFGYKRKAVEQHLAALQQEHTMLTDNQQARLELLSQENEHMSQILKTLGEENQRLASDNEQYRTQLVESGAANRTMQERLDLLSTEIERLQDALQAYKKENNSADPTMQEWKARALAAEETVRRFAEAELRANAEREHARHIRLPFGKKAYLDMTLHKDDTSI